MIISGQPLREKLSEESYKLANERFSLEKVTEQVGEVYEEVESLEC